MKKAAKLPKPPLLLDAGALIKAEKDTRSKTHINVWEAYGNERTVLLPTVVLAQVWRDTERQHGLRALCGSCKRLGFPTRMARRVGGLLKAAGTSDIVDAMVVLAAIEHEAVVLTSDPKDLKALVEAAEADVPLIAV